MPTELALYREDDLAPLRGWLGLPADEARRRVVQAVQQRDLHLLDDLLTAYLHDSHGGGSPHTLRAYRAALRNWLTYAGTQAINVLHPSVAEAGFYRSTLEARVGLRQKPPLPNQKPLVLSASTVGQQLAGVRALYRAFMWVGACEHNPFDGIRVSKRARKGEDRSPYLDNQVGLLLAAPAPAWLHLAVLLGADVGLRVSEMTRLHWRDVDFQSEVLHVVGKGEKARVVMASSPRLLARLLQVSPRLPDQPLLEGQSPQQVRRHLKKLCLVTGVPYLAVHALRHTCGTQLVKAGVSLQQIAYQFGHASVTTTERYTRHRSDAVRNVQKLLVGNSD